MTVEIMTVISTISVLIGIAGTLIGILRNKKQDDKADASESTALMIKLENIANDCAEIKNDIKSVKEDTKSNTEKIIRMEESLKSAWNLINKLQDYVGLGGNHGNNDGQ